MSQTTPTNAGPLTVVLVHGAFAEASSWTGVIERLQKASRLLKNFFPKLISKDEGMVMVSFLFSKDFEEKRLR